MNIKLLLNAITYIFTKIVAMSGDYKRSQTQWLRRLFWDGWATEGGKSDFQPIYFHATS